MIINNEKGITLRRYRVLLVSYHTPVQKYTTLKVQNVRA